MPNRHSPLMKNASKNSATLPLEQHHYDTLDGLRAIAVVGIVLMHVISHLPIAPGNFLTNNIIPDFTNFTYLFMVLSAFSMCCGYYKKVKDGNIDFERFYKRRFSRILPFFGLMVLIELVKDHNLVSLEESFANITLCFGLYPNADISVIGVGWFLGLVFVFYMLFPFFVFLLSNKRRAWITLAVAVGLYMVGILHFAADQNMPFERKNILFSASFFIVGGIIYLYRESITKWIKNNIWMATVLVLGITTAHYCTLNIQGNTIFPHMIVFALWIVFCIGSSSRLLSNKVMKFISNISLEIYLCHMMLFHAVGFLHMENHIQNDVWLYVITAFLTFVLAAAFSYLIKYLCFPHLEKFFKKQA